MRVAMDMAGAEDLIAKDLVFEGKLMKKWPYLKAAKVSGHFRLAICKYFKPSMKSKMYEPYA